MTDVQPATEFTDVLLSLADSLKPEFDVIEAMATVVQATVSFTGAAAVGILLVDSAGKLRIATSSGEGAADVEERQLGAEQGPCIECYLAGHQIGSDDLASDRDRWPAFVDAALQQGFRSVHAFPLRLREKSIGALNVFCTQPGDLSDSELAAIQAMTGIVTISVLQKDALDAHATLASQLQLALDERVVIEQAKGILMERLGVNSQKAFELLRSRARARREKLGDTASAVVDQHDAV